jgi:hypothetical protein
MVEWIGRSCGQDSSATGTDGAGKEYSKINVLCNQTSFFYMVVKAKRNSVGLY